MRKANVYFNGILAGGMSFSNGDKLDGKQLNVYYIDPLAPFFNNIIKKTKLNLPKITFGFIEYLSAFVPNKVSLIIVQNALDHSKNPLKGILECIESLEIGGVLYLKHFRNEAETENYRGFHQYNISTENDDVIIWNKENKTNIKLFLNEFAETTTSTSDNEVVAVITKKKELPNGLIDSKNDLANLSNEYIEIIQNLGEISYTLSYQFNRFKFRIIHQFMQLFSWKVRQDIKNIIRKITFIKRTKK
ncbi:MAG: hypothetical protein BGO29_12290 [Bacteroidales bacterium 36-12]|nr:MAG: hypothetical protein BGO29_12290 [Bacteroidales bacterium 36-12]